MVKITKKITAIVLAGILMVGGVGGTPIIVEAKTTKTSSTKKVDWSKKYPKLKNPKKKDIKKVAYSKETNAKINRIIKKLDQLEKKFSMKVLNQIWAGICDITQTQSHEDTTMHQEDDQFDYVIYKATYYSFIYTIGKERDKLFIKICDDLYLASAKRLNSGKHSGQLREHSMYYGSDLYEYFQNEKVQKALRNFMTMTMSLSNVSICPPDGWNGDYDDYDYKVDETILPSNLKPLIIPDSEDLFKPEYNIGLSFEKYCKEAVKLGFKKTNDFQDPSGTTQEVYGYMVNGVLLGSISVCNDFRGRNLQIVMRNGYHINSAYKKWKTTLQKSFNLLLPTQGKELFDIISQKDIKDKIITKTFTMDGREVTVVVDEVKDPKTNKQEQLILVVFR